MCEKLYETDAYLTEFTATVLAVKEEGDGLWATLDRTAFFPEGGGQAGDCGYLGPLGHSSDQYDSRLLAFGCWLFNPHQSQ